MIPPSLEHDIYGANSSSDGDKSEIEPFADYENVFDDYQGNTYYNVGLKRNFFDSNANPQYIMIETRDIVDTDEGGSEQEG